jgi:hypothetical protein
MTILANMQVRGKLKELREREVKVVDAELAAEKFPAREAGLATREAALLEREEGFSKAQAALTQAQKRVEAQLESNRVC